MGAYAILVCCRGEAVGTKTLKAATVPEHLTALHVAASRGFAATVSLLEDKIQMMNAPSTMILHRIATGKSGHRTALTLLHLWLRRQPKDMQQLIEKWRKYANHQQL